MASSFNLDGSLIATASSDKNVRIYKLNA